MKSVLLICHISKQGHDQAVKRAKELESKKPFYVGFICEIRLIHPGMGLRSMHKQFQPEGIGRDAFVALGLQEGFRLRSIKSPMKTTWSVKNNRYANLLGAKWFTAVNQLWVSDIFYFPLNGRHYYVVLIMDAYSRRIIGYSVADNLRRENNLNALSMAIQLRGIKNFKEQLIHHSDRGSQYISDDYTSTLEEHGIRISMCTNVLENAHMERANGTIKNDYLARWNIQFPNQLTKFLRKAVNGYNNRWHTAHDRMSPIEFEIYVNELEVKDKPVLKVFTIHSQNSDNPNQLKLDFDL